MSKMSCSDFVGHRSWIRLASRGSDFFSEIGVLTQFPDFDICSEELNKQRSFEIVLFSNYSLVCARNNRIGCGVLTYSVICASLLSVPWKRIRCSSCIHLSSLCFAFSVEGHIWVWPRHDRDGEDEESTERKRVAVGPHKVHRQTVPNAIDVSEVPG